MANLNGQNIGTNYKGFLNLDSTINTPLDATLRAVTDGMGTSSVLQLSTDQVGISRTVALSAGATNPRLFNELYTINNSGAQTGTLTGIFLNATETALNGMGHNLMDLQVGGVSKFKVDNSGNATISNQLKVGLSGNFFITLNSTGINFSGGLQRIEVDANLLLKQQTSTFGLLQLGGTTSSFPAIKRNGAAIDFRLADDSGYCSIRGFYGIFDLVYNSTFNIGFAGGTTGIHLNSVGSTIFSATGATSINSSAQVQIDSTTKGFLPPRQTTAQINAISTPAAGLQVYNTDLAQPCFYDGTGWRKVSHTTM
jgi:hypothetical protein